MIRLFPSKTYSVRLVANDSSVWVRLREDTELQDSLVTVLTSKTFIGQIRPGQFKLISSRIGRGAFCTFEGMFNALDGSGRIHVQVHKAFRILILVWPLLPVCGLAYAFYAHGPAEGVRQLLMIVALLLMIRFIYIEWLFRSVAKSGLDALAVLLGLVDVKEVGP